MIYLFFTILSVFIQGVFALFEMAALSMNRIRLQYYASIGNKRALWLHTLLQQPSRFFGTTLIGINTALLMGSECSRRFYEYLNFDPDLAPITQIFLVVIVGELSPMFAARRHPSQLALSLVPLMTLISRIFTPFIWFFGLLSRLIGGVKESAVAFSREEISVAFHHREDSEDDLNAMTEKIFQFKNQTAGQMMTPLDQVITVPATATMFDITRILKRRYEPIIFIFRHQKHQIVAATQVRDLLRLADNETIFEKSKAPWFVSEETSLLEVLHQFRNNKQSAAVILDLTGKARGVLTLDQMISQIFGREEAVSKVEEIPNLFIERTLSGEKTIAAFNLEFNVNIPHEEGETISDLMVRELGHTPVRGETVCVGTFEFKVEEATLLGVGVASVSTMLD